MYTQAIKVFEGKVLQIRSDYKVKMLGSTAISLQLIEARDEELAQCLWAIEALHAAHVEAKRGGDVGRHAVLCELASAA